MEENAGRATKDAHKENQPNVLLVWAPSVGACAANGRHQMLRVWRKDSCMHRDDE